jgi:hypothetical protein
MTVVLNEAALAALLSSQEGPVGRFVEGIAERVVLQAQQNVRSYFASSPTLDVDQDIGLSMDGSQATVGIRDAGTKARRLADAQAQGQINWLRDALSAVSDA